jgi:hypothetical protein
VETLSVPNALSGLPQEFAVAAGGVTGRAHRRAERDGQDGHALVVTEEVVAAVVTDGCSSGRSSEIGARIGAAWLAALVAQSFAPPNGAAPPDGPALTTAIGTPFEHSRPVHDEPSAREAAESITQALVARLELLARSFDPAGEVDAARVDQALLFGFLAAVVSPRVSFVFGVGDGAFVVDDRVTVLDPGPDNAPPYAAYGLLGVEVAPRLHFFGYTAGVRRLAVATDGLAPLDPPALLTLVSDPRYAANPSLLRKRLVVLSDGGAFSDDATVAVIQRRRT